MEKIIEKEKQLLADRWDKFGLLKGLDEEYKKEVATLLENQRLHNERSVDIGDIAQFKRIITRIGRNMVDPTYYSLLTFQNFSNE